MIVWTLGTLAAIAAVLFLVGIAFSVAGFIRDFINFFE